MPFSQDEYESKDTYERNFKKFGNGDQEEILSLD